MEFLSKNDKDYISKLFEKNVQKLVNIMLFIDSADKCQYCKDTVELMKELASISDKVKVTIYDTNLHQKEAKFLRIDKTPAIVIGGKKLYNMFYFGIPAGHEFAALLEDIVDVSNGVTRLSDDVKARVRKIAKPVEIKVFVTPTCPYCPRAVRTAHQFAMENDKIRSSMIEATEFYDLSKKYEVMAVPKVVINDSVSFEGALPEENFLAYVEEAVNKK